MTTKATKAPKGLPERINVAELVREKDKGALKFFFFLLLGVPAILYGIGWLIATQTGKVPTLIWVVIVLDVLFAGAAIAGDFKNRREPEKDSRFRWPEVGSRDEVIRLIEDEWNNTPANQKEMFGERYVVTPSWLIDMNDFRPRPLRYVVWVHSSAKSSYVNGVPTGTTYRVQIHHSGIANRMPWSVEVGSEEEGTEMLFTLRRRAPWAFYGFSEPYFRAWKDDKEGIMAAAKARYDTMQAGQSIEQPSEPMETEQTRA